MTSGQLIRQARLRAGLTQAELAERIKKPRQQVVRWESDTVEPGLSTLRRLLRACGFDVSVSLIPYAPDPEREARLEAIRRETPKERLARLLDELES